MIAALRPLLLVSAAVALVLAAGCSAARRGAAFNPQIPESASSSVLRTGDSLTVSLQGIPDPATHTVQINEQGVINLPFIGDVKAAGISIADLSRAVETEYVRRRFYTAVNVSINIAERYVYVGGEVARPGRILWTPDLTASKAVQAAGGFSLYAKESAVIVTRDEKAYPIDINLAQRVPSEDPRLQPGDSLQVPRSAF